MGKKIVLLSVISLFAFTLNFAGCGKDEEPAPPPPPAAQEAPAGQMAPTDGEQKAQEQPEQKMEQQEEGAKTN